MLFLQILWAPAQVWPLEVSTDSKTLDVHLTEETGEAGALHPHFSWIIFHVVHELENIFTSGHKVHWNTPLWVIFDSTLKSFKSAGEKKGGTIIYIDYIDHWQIIDWRGNNVSNLSQTRIRTRTVVRLFCFRSLFSLVKRAIISATMLKLIQSLIAKQVSLGADEQSQ